MRVGADYQAEIPEVIAGKLIRIPTNSISKRAKVLLAVDCHHVGAILLFSLSWLTRNISKPLLFCAYVEIHQVIRMLFDYSGDLLLYVPYCCNEAIC